MMRPTGVAYDAAGDLFIADTARNQVFEISVGGAISIVAGSGTQGFSGDGGSATAAELNAPMSVAAAADGTIYIADTGNQRIRAVRGGNITTFAGNGARGFAGDGGLATSAALNHPVAVALDAAGALLVCDQGNERVRRISAGHIATIAGNGVQGFAGDGGAATSAELNEPSGVTASADGRIFIADTENQRIRVISSSGIISSFAGTGVAGMLGDGGSATNAQVSHPVGVAIDTANNLFIAEENSHRLRRVAAGGIVTTIAGSGRQGAAADGAVAVSSAQNQPAGTAVSPFGWPVIADVSNHSVQIVFTDGRVYLPGGLSAHPSLIRLAAPDAVYGTAQSAITFAGSPATPQGVVEIADGSTPIASASLAQGAAVIALSTLAAGTHTLTAAYAGDGLHGSATATATIVVSPAPVIATAAGATISYGAPLPTLTGSLSGVLPQDQGNVSAVFRATQPMPSVGSYPITATLTGPASANYTVSSSPNSGTLTIVPAATTATLTPPSAAYATLPLQLTARVASTTSGTPTGTVQFLDAGNVIATAPLVNGIASAIELNPSSGSHTLSVAYSGDANFQVSTSAKVIEAVNAMPDFTVGITGNSQLTVIAGSSATFNLTIGSQGAPFTGSVTLSATGLPAGATASFSPPAVVPGASSAAVTMTVATRTTTALNSSAKPELGFAATGAILLFAFWRKRTVSRLLAVLAIAGLFGLTGCGARTAPESVLPVQSFTIQVQATGTNLAGNVVVHTVNVKLGLE